MRNYNVPSDPRIADDKDAMTARREMPAPPTSADDWDALDRIARQLTNGAGRELRRAPETEPVECAVEKRGRDAAALLELVDLLPLAVALFRHGEMVHANGTFAYAFGYSSFAQLDAAGGAAALFTDGLDLNALRMATRRTAMRARSRGGRRMEVSVLVRRTPGDNEIDLVMLSEAAAQSAPVEGEPPDPKKVEPAVPLAGAPEVFRAPFAGVNPLEPRDQAKDRLDFLAKISHEIRTPLNSIIGFAELMLGERLGRVGNERYRSYLKNIQDSGQFALRLVNDLLDISKVQSGAFQVDFTSVDPRETIEAAVRTVQPFARKARVVVRVSIADDAPRVLADLFRLKQVMLNLLTNAIKFTPEHGQVVASASMLHDGGLRLQVRDSGVGMSAPDIQIAMQPFRQLDTAPRIETGTGLGLPLTKTLVEAMRGQLIIESDIGEGTTIDVVFPADRIVK